MTRKWIWASLAISSMWIAVLFVGLFGPVLETENAAGDRVTVPVATFVVALFALVATIVVAAVGFREERR
jgi:hypothetical protein